MRWSPVLSPVPNTDQQEHQIGFLWDFSRRVSGKMSLHLGQLLNLSSAREPTSSLGS